MAVFGGLCPAARLGLQAQEGKLLMQSSAVLELNVRVVNALDLSGTFVLQTPLDVTQQTLTSELQQVPGFIFAQDFTPGPGIPPDDNNGINGDFVDGAGYSATFGGPFDYQKFVREEASGALTTHAGPVTNPPGTND